MSNALSNLWGQLTGWFNIHGVSVAWDWSTLWQGISEVWGNVQTALGGLWNQITGWFSSHMPDFTHLWDGVLTAWDNFKTFSLDSVKGLLNNLVTTINNAIFWINQNIINPLKQFNIAGWYPFSGMGYVSYIPKLAEGGIVTSPTLAMVGEAGPEAVIPLDKMGTGNVVHLHVGAMMGNETDARKFARLITDYMRENNRTQTIGRLA